jgi:hypothetical protein
LQLRAIKFQTIAENDSPMNRALIHISLPDHEFSVQKETNFIITFVKL